MTYNLDDLAEDSLYGWLQPLVVKIIDYFTSYTIASVLFVVLAIACIVGFIIIKSQLNKIWRKVEEAEKEINVSDPK